jgi:ferric-dicitrate binding protein FerR (iron transport regulator)
VEKQRNLVDLLDKYHKGLLSKEEKALLDDWFEALGKSHIPDQLPAEDKIEIKNNLRTFIKKRQKTESNSQSEISIGVENSGGEGAPSSFNVAIPFLYRIAASLLFVALIGYGSYTYYEQKQAEKFAAVEAASSKEVQKILLPDGSIVWLKPNSALTYPKNFKSEGERIVGLKGEALFEVEKDPSRPFIVHVGGLTTTVLGTSFNIKTINDKIEVLVLTGKVSLTSTMDKQHIIVLPDQRAVYDRMTNELNKIETPVEQHVAEAVVKDTEYDMNFNDTRMDEISRRIEGKFNVKIYMEDPALGNCVITADFTDQSLSKTLDIIKAALSMEYELKDGDVILKGKGCK